MKYKKNFTYQWLDAKKLLAPVAGFLCPSRWITHIMLINAIIIIHLSKWIEFNFD